ncbi:hypothetical protein ACSXD3_17785 (plasmid) [Clostridium perfringens]
MNEFKILEVIVEEKESSEVVAVSFHKAIVERLGTKKMESYADEITEIIERINEEL